MGAVQKLATVVIVGLVALATVLVVYLANEGNRRDDEASAQDDVAVERAIDTYVTNCLTCHGPAGEGFSEPGAQGTGRIGFPLGGQTEAGLQAMERNQATDPAAWTERREEIWMALHYGRGLMPAWGRGGGGQLNDEQIDELILMIHTVDWDRVYNHAIEAAGGGYPTPGPPPPPAGGAQPTAAASPVGGTPGPGGGGAASEVTIIAGLPQELAFDPAQVTIPANTEVTLSLPNEGALPHNFSIDALSINVNLETGASEQATVNAAPGDYEFYCNIPGHKEGGMFGTLTAE